MPVWDPARYLQFADDRSRPFVDLVARVQGTPRTIVDLGCGPGHLTQVLRHRWPEATVHGVDSSPEMIERARNDQHDDAATYELADVTTWAPAGRVDLVISNALFQWVPDQLAVIERLAGHVALAGTFALQVPRNYDAPSHTLLRDIAAERPFAAHTADVVADRGTEPAAYLELFAARGWEVDLWETTYHHVLAGDDPVHDWVSGTGARPYLQALPDDLRDAFTRAYRSALRDAYPRRPWGTVFPFRRTFLVARQPA
ncbi:methyltransferase domain-containing protein [Aeromicrobium wangtongii]|uniref:methyltransferase domain-containing protein n=1 Tax=Aeromicrobium wangtongii TaxID=2969247 RepID=UPI002017B50F|nr:methyltransferase domain-containing protein [Aeromicrobium wangtongii]MCL3817824.1 methyltransferase domain-containing protein [Aeromicrobium wangtongii]